MSLLLALALLLGVPPIAPHFRVTKARVTVPRPCRPAPVVKRIVATLTAFDAGLGAAFAREFSEDGVFVAYAGTPAARGRAQIAAEVVKRNARGDGWTATILHAPVSPAGLPDATTYELGLNVRFRGAQLEGRGAKLVVGCRSGLVRKWLGPALAVPP